MTKEMTEEQRDNYSLELTATTGAEADGLDTNTIKVSLVKGSEFVSRQAVVLAVTAGSAVFVTNDNQEVTLTTDAFGGIAAKISDTTQETVTVTATLVNDKTVTAKVTTEFSKVIVPGRDGSLKVMGGRSQWVGREGISGAPVHTLTALDTETLQPQVATWQYVGEIPTVTGERFRDIHPDRVLKVSTANDWVQLNTSNINGASTSMLARSNSGYVMGWGYSRHGGQVPSDIAAMNDIVITATSQLACAALRSNGHVVVWGDIGGSLPDDIAQYDDLIALASTIDAFAALQANGMVIAWGTADCGGSVPDDIARLSNITCIVGSEQAFAALRANGSVVTWGRSEYGGTVPDEIAHLTDIVAVTAGSEGFAALRANGHVVAWGGAGSSSMPADIAAYDDVIEVMGGNGVFLVRRADGSVNAWGSGRVPSAVLALKDIIGMATTKFASVVLRANGQMMAWGDVNYGGTMPENIAKMHSIVQVLGNGGSLEGGAFCALCRDGSVVSWGHESYGGLISGSAAYRLRDVRAVYSGGYAFAALTGDDRVVTWGARDFGGDSSSVQADLDGQISYEMKS